MTHSNPHLVIMAIRSASLSIEGRLHSTLPDSNLNELVNSHTSTLSRGEPRLTPIKIQTGHLFSVPYRNITIPESNCKTTFQRHPVLIKRFLLFFWVSFLLNVALVGASYRRKRLSRGRTATNSLWNSQPQGVQSREPFDSEALFS